MKTWIVEMIAQSAYRHGQGYAKSNIYRNVGKFAFKNPEAIGLPDWVVGIDIETHQWLANLYRHASRQGLKSKVD